MSEDTPRPWRASFVKKARCGMCLYFGGLYNYKCFKGHQVIGPVITGEHHCKDYEFKPDNLKRVEPPHSDCLSCSKWFDGQCDGIDHWPYEVHPKCEFWRDADLTCRNAVPMRQYGNGNRNNYCRLPPHRRDGDAKRGWKWLCPQAHHAWCESLKCYRPRKP